MDGVPISHAVMISYQVRPSIVRLWDWIERMQHLPGVGSGTAGLSDRRLISLRENRRTAGGGRMRLL